MERGFSKWRRMYVLWLNECMYVIKSKINKKSGILPPNFISIYIFPKSSSKSRSYIWHGRFVERFLPYLHIKDSEKMTLPQKKTWWVILPNQFGASYPPCGSIWNQKRRNSSTIVQNICTIQGVVKAQKGLPANTPPPVKRSDRPIKPLKGWRRLKRTAIFCTYSC